MTTTETWPSEWLRGVLQLAALRVLSDGPRHGYAIATRLSEAGLGEVKGGTLYPLLGRLEQAGLVAAQWLPGDGGPGRKEFSLTPAGRRHLEDQVTQWRRFNTVVSTLFD